MSEDDGGAARTRTVPTPKRARCSRSRASLSRSSVACRAARSSSVMCSPWQRKMVRLKRVGMSFASMPRDAGASVPCRFQGDPSYGHAKKLGGASHGLERPPLSRICGPARQRRFRIRPSMVGVRAEAIRAYSLSRCPGDCCSRRSRRLLQADRKDKAQQASRYKRQVQSRLLTVGWS